MKQILIALCLIGTLGSCTTPATPPFIVAGIEQVEDHQYKYLLNFKDNRKDDIIKSIFPRPGMYSNRLFQIGDTLTIHD